MMDELPTRAALTVAAFVLLATGLSVISLSGDSAAIESARDLVSHIARQLDAIGRVDAEVATRFGPGEQFGVSLPTQIGGHSYRLEVRATDVRVIADAGLAAHSLMVRVHPFAPAHDAYAASELEDLDRNTTLTIASGESFLAIRTALLVDGALSFLTFVHAG